MLEGLLLSHEFAHSWNGKYRHPADMVTPDFQQSKRTRLLWVYEGLTHYLTVVLATRSGLWTQEQCQNFLAVIATGVQNQRGRVWRPLEDTTVGAQFLFQARGDWASWRRGVDFYAEGVLIWLEVDTLIRQKTQGRRSLDDFCRRFFGEKIGTARVVPYTFEDIVAELNSIAPSEWKSLLTERVTSIAPQAPLGGLEQSGWRIIYADAPSEAQKMFEKIFKTINLTASIGILFREDGSIIDIIPDKAAHRAGIGPAMKVVAVNSRRWSSERLLDAVAATKDGKQPLELLVENGDFFTSYHLDYQEGAKFPRLERDSSRVDVLAQIIKPLTLTKGEAKSLDSQ